MKPRKNCDGAAAVPPWHETPPPNSQPASNVNVNAAFEIGLSGWSTYFTWMLSSVWKRLRPGFPSVSVPM